VVPIYRMNKILKSVFAERGSLFILFMTFARYSIRGQHNNHWNWEQVRDGWLAKSDVR
jgi:hypothetical protein